MQKLKIDCQKLGGQLGNIINPPPSMQTKQNPSSQQWEQ